MAVEYFHTDENDNIILSTYSMEMIIPEFYFDKSDFAVDNGDTISMLGVCTVNFKDKDEKIIDTKILAVPTMTTVYVYDYDTDNRNLPGFGTIKCRVLYFYKNSRVMAGTVIKDSVNVEKYFNFIVKGDVPANIKYNDTLSLWLKNQELNNTTLGVSAAVMELILSVAYRSKDNPQYKFATVIGKDPDKVSEYDYLMNNIRQICQNTSTYTGIIFEDIDSMITTSLNRTLKKVKEPECPTEVMLKL